MANKDWARGLQPVFAVGGGSPRTQRWPLKYAVSTTPTQYTTAIYKGQIVGWLANTTIGGYAIAGAGTAIGGIIHGGTNTTGMDNTTGILGVAAEYFKGTGSTATSIAVWPLKEHVWMIQSDNNTTTSTVASMRGKNYSLVNPTAGSTITGYSTMELDFSSGVTNSWKPFRVIGHYAEIGESATGANLKVIVEPLLGVHHSDHSTNMTA